MQRIKITGLVKTDTTDAISSNFGMFQFYHYLNKGWIGYHTASPWAPSFEWGVFGADGQKLGTAMLENDWFWKMACIGNITLFVDLL